MLQACPIFTVSSVAGMIGRSAVATGSAVNQLAEAGVLRQRTVGKERYRVFEVPDVIRLISQLDRELSLQSPPARDATSLLEERSRAQHDPSVGFDVGALTLVEVDGRL